MDLNFHALNLDEAYETISSLDRLATTTGEPLTTKLNATIGALKKNWIGPDATLHINRLIDIYDEVSDVVQAVHALAYDASKEIVHQQEVLSSNGGRVNVGAVINNLYDIAKIERVPDTVEVFNNPTELPNNLRDLSIVKEDFTNFSQQFNNLKNDLERIWISGANRENIVNGFDEFTSLTTTFTKNLEVAESDLTTVVKNITA